MHCDKNGNTDYSESFLYSSSSQFFKQLLVKASHIKLSLQNQTSSDQTFCRLYCKLLNSIPDDVNVKLTDDDVVTAVLKTSEGNLTSERGMLNVNPRGLNPLNDVVGAQVSGFDGETYRPLSVDSNGKLNVNTSAGPVLVNTSYINLNLKNDPQVAFARTCKVKRCIGYNDGNQLRYLVLLDSNSTEMLPMQPLAVLPLKAGDSFYFELGLDCSAGCVVAVTDSNGPISDNEITLTAIFESVD